MSEADFRQRAQHYDGIRCDYYPPQERSGKPILQTLQPVQVGSYRVDDGRWTDGGSVPRIAHAVAHPFGYLFRAYLVHDTSLFDGYGWADSDRRFNSAMRALGAPTWQRLAIIAGVKANARWQHIRAWLGWEADYVGDDARPGTAGEIRRTQARFGRVGP